MDGIRPALEVRFEWPYRGSDGGPFVCVRLVRSCEGTAQNADLAFVYVHSDILMYIESSYFGGMAERFNANPSPTIDLDEVPLLGEVTLHVDGDDDVQFYIHCFTTMYDYGNNSFKYNPPEKGVEGLRYTLRLLGAASHMDHYHLMLSITRYLKSIPWSSEENMVVLRETPMRKDGLRCLIQACCYSEKVTARVLIHQLLKVHGWRPFEQEVVAMVHEDLNGLLEEAHKECDGKESMESGMYELPHKLIKICRILMKLMVAQVARHGVKCLLQYPSIPKFLSSIKWSHERNVVAVVEAFKSTTVIIYKEVVSKTLLLENSDRYALLKDWTNFLEGYETHEDRRGLDPEYKIAKEAIFGSLPVKEKMELVHMTAQYGYYFNFGKPEKLSKMCNKSMDLRE